MDKKTALISNALDAIYEAALDPSIWPDALQKITDCFEDVGTVLLFQKEDGTTGNIVSPRLAAAQHEFNLYWWDKDIRGQRALERGLFLRSDAITDRHVVSPEEIRTHPIYTQFNAKHGLGWVAGVAILPHPKTPVWISVQRAMSKPQFTDDELELVVVLGRHAENSLRLGMRQITGQAIVSNLSDVLAGMECGAVVLDGTDKPLFENAEARRISGNGFYLQEALRKRAGRAPRSIAPARAGASARSGELVEETNPVLIERPGGRPLVFYFVPVRLSQPLQHAALFCHAQTIVIILDLEVQAAVDPALLRSVLGLTLAEARVAAIVGSGSSPKATAESLGLAEDTVRKALKSVFAKTGVSRQSELSLLISRLSLVQAKA